MIETSVRNSGSVRLIRLAGDLRASSGDSGLTKVIEPLMVEGTVDFVLDLKGMRFIDTMGIGELVRLRKLAREKGGDLKIASPSQKVHDVLKMMKLDTVFDIHESDIAALSAFRR